MPAGRRGLVLLAVALAATATSRHPPQRRAQVPAKPQTDVAGLRGAGRRAAALAARRAVGDAALAALRRGAALPAARGRPRRRSGASCATTRAPRPARAQQGWEPRRARARRWSRRGRGSCATRAARRCSSSARCARSPRATSPSTCSSTRCTRTRSRRRPRDLRRRRAASSSGAAPRRAEPAADLPPQRALAPRTPEAAAERPARARRLGRPHQAIPAAQARAPARAPAAPAPALAAADALQRPAAARTPRSSPATASNYSNNAALSATAARVVFESYEAEAGARQGAGRSRCWRAPAGARRRPRSRAAPAPDAALGLQPGGLGRRPLGRLRVRRGQPQLRQALRARWACSSATCAAAARRSATRPALAVSRSAYNPTISGDGRLVAYEAYDRPDQPGGADATSWCATSAEARARGAGARRRPPTLYEPRLSADGRRLAFTHSRPARASARGLRPRPAQRPQPARLAPGEEAWEPTLSARGTVVAYTAAGPGGESHVVVRDLAHGASRRSPRRPAPGSRSSRRCRPPAGASPSWRGPAARARRRCSCATCGRARRSSSRARTASTARPGWAARAIRRSRATAPRRLHLGGLEPVAPEVQQRARDLRARPRSRDHAAGERGRRRQPLPRPDEGLEHAQRRLYHPPLRVTAVLRVPG